MPILISAPDNAEWCFGENDLKIVTFKVKQVGTASSRSDSAYASSVNGLPSGAYPSPGGQYTVACVMSLRSKKVYLSSEAKPSEFEALSDLKDSLEEQVGKKIAKATGELVPWNFLRLTR